MILYLLLFIFFVIVLLVTLPIYRRTIINYPPSDKDYLRLRSESIKSNKSSNRLIRNEKLDLKNTEVFSNFFKKNRLDVFIIADKYDVIFEKFRKNYSSETLVSVWSITKVFVGALTYLAIKDGYLKSDNELVVDILPELKNKISSKVEIKHLLNMTSGINFSKSNLDLNPYLHVHYGADLNKYMQTAKTIIEPGLAYHYSQMDLVILMKILRKVTKKTLASYLEEKFWLKLETINDAYWLIDDSDSKLERPASGLFICGEDIIKFAQLFLNKGQCNQNQLIDSNYIADSISNEKDNFEYMKYFWKHSFRIKEDSKVLSSFKAGLKNLIPFGNTFVNGANNNKLLYIHEEKQIILFCSGSGLLNKNIVSEVNSLLENNYPKFNSK